MPINRSGHFVSGWAKLAYPHRNCVVCGADFGPIVPKQKTCSDACGYARSRLMSDRALARRKAARDAIG